jgi:hypothetical protein
MFFKTPAPRITFLMGGLGNQLFQIARGLHGLDSTDFLLCVFIRGITKLNSKGLPEASDTLSTIFGRVKYQEFKPNYFQLKLIKFGIRLSTSSRKLSFLKDCTRLVTKSALRLFVCPKHSFFIADGVGYCGERPTKRMVCFIGYFQSHSYSAIFSRVLDEEKNFPLELTPKAKILFLEAKRVRPIIIHVRLGDYTLESKFGTLSEEYYRYAISIYEKDSTPSIYWVFSDDLGEAKNLFQNMDTRDFRFIDDEGLTSIEILQIMREGGAYVIGNSTFSYWAALLSRDKDARVIAPSRWFKELQTPIGLYPPDWQLVGENFALFN